MPEGLPYKIAVLCYLYDADGHVLLLHRRQDPNRGMYSPIGGKLDTWSGEGPHDCAAREIVEETGMTVEASELRMIGLVSETAYQGETHWLIFLFEVERPVGRDEIRWSEFKEGTLEWKHPDEVPDLAIPATDREVMWPLVRSQRDQGTGSGFFAVHIDCSGDEVTWTVHECDAPASCYPASHGGQEVGDD